MAKFTLVYQDEPILDFVADSVDSVPTQITGANPEDVTYAESLVARFPEQATCRAILSRWSMYGAPHLIPG